MKKKTANYNGSGSNNERRASNTGVAYRVWCDETYLLYKNDTK